MACLCYLRVKYAEKQHELQDFYFCKAFFNSIRDRVHFRKDMLKRGIATGDIGILAAAKTFCNDLRLYIDIPQNGRKAMRRLSTARFSRGVTAFSDIRLRPRAKSRTAPPRFSRN